MGTLFHLDLGQELSGAEDGYLVSTCEVAGVAAQYAVRPGMEGAEVVDSILEIR